jgi:hypothetical protein
VPRGAAGNLFSEVPLYGPCHAQFSGADARAAERSACEAGRKRDLEEARRQEERERVITSLEAVPDPIERLLRALVTFARTGPRPERIFPRSEMVIHVAGTDSWAIERIAPGAFANGQLLEPDGYDDEAIAAWFARWAVAAGVPRSSFPWPEPRRTLFGRYKQAGVHVEVRDGARVEGWVIPDGSTVRSGGQGARALIDVQGRLDLGPLRISDGREPWHEGRLTTLGLYQLARLLEF